MGVASKLTPEVKSWGSLGIVVVLVSIILNQFKDITGATATTNATVDLFVNGLQEPGNWVAIVINFDEKFIEIDENCTHRIRVIQVFRRKERFRLELPFG